MTELVEDSLYAPYVVAKSANVLGEIMQMGVGGLVALVLGGKEYLYFGNGYEASHEVEEFLLLHVGAFQLETCHALPYVKEIVEGEVVFLLTDSAKLANLCQTRIDKLGIIGKRHIAYALPAEGAQTVAPEHLADFGESYLLFKIIGVNQL